MYKGYVVTLENIPDSVRVAKRCIESGKKYNVNVEMFPAVWRDDVDNAIKSARLKVDLKWKHIPTYKAQIANFLSQYKVWQRIRRGNKPAIVLEHDAVFTMPVREDLETFGDLISLGKPSYGEFTRRRWTCVKPLFSKEGGNVPGAHGYFVTPTGAQELISKAREVGAGPVDSFLHLDNFPNFLEAYPWPIEVIDEFTTIQDEQTIKLKLNVDFAAYKII